MIQIPGYKIIDNLHIGQRILVYRAIRESDDTSVILKILASEYPEESELRRLEKENQMIQSLSDEPDMIRSFGLFDFQKTRYLELEDIGGVPLTEVVTEGGIPVDRFLDIAIQIVESVSRIHRKSIIHKDLKPQNIIYKASTGQIQIIDFGISSRFPRFAQSERSSGGMEGSLQFISPEQTGWTEQMVDLRSDYYTLGITFFYLLTGNPPFEAEDSLDLVYSHLAREPELVHTLRPLVPEMVSRIVDKLLKKNPEQRYQTDHGLLSDLYRCKEELEKTGSIDEFPVGRNDVSERFEIPARLYGRESEVRDLGRLFELVVEGRSETVLVSGRPGIGKSALIQEIKKIAISNRSFFISGKFEQYRTESPYSGFVQCFDDLINQVLTHSPAEVEKWKHTLQEEIGTSAGVLTDLVPRLEILLGKQDRSPAALPMEARNRFFWLVQQFLTQFAQSGQPLVLFIDDVQWADLSSLYLLQSLLKTPELNHILFVVSFRDQSSAPNNLLHEILQDIRTFRKEKSLKTGGISPLFEIYLEVLDEKSITEFVADALHTSTTNAELLAKLVYKRTAGNPFFAGQFLLSSYKEGLIWFDHDAGSWNWNTEQIGEREYTENVIRLMQKKFNTLDESVRDVLSFASVIGPIFRLELLGFLLGRNKDELIDLLNQAIEEEFIFVMELDFQYSPHASREEDFYYRFLHDQIRDTAYLELDESRRADLHLSIGQYLLRSVIPDEAKQEDQFIPMWISQVAHEQKLEELQRSVDEAIFNIVDHLNGGKIALRGETDQSGLAVLNLVAARKSIRSSGYESALDYLNTAKELLPEESWKNAYFITLNIHLDLLIAEYVKTNFVRTEELSRLIMDNSTSLLDRLDVFKIRIASLTPQNRMDEAIKSGIEYLSYLGVHIPAKVNEMSPLPHIIRAHLKVGKKVDQLIHRKPMEDPEKRAAMELLVELFTPAFISRPVLAPVLTMKMIHLTLEHGLTAEAAYGFVTFALVLGSGLGYYRGADRYGQLALATLEKFPGSNLEAKVLFLYGNMIHHWQRSAKTGQKILLEAYQKGLRSGDLLFASYALNWYNAYNYLTRKKLQEVVDTMDNYTASVERIRQSDAAAFYNLWHQFAKNLNHQKTISVELKGSSFNEEESLPLWLEINNDTDLFTYYMMKGLLYYLKGDFQNSIEMHEKAIPRSGGVFGMPVVSEHNFYYSLSLCGVLGSGRSMTDSQARRYKKTIQANQKKLKKWASFSPENYRHKYLLIEAEFARINTKGQLDASVIGFYEQTISYAIETGYQFEEALAVELLGRYYLKGGKQFIGKSYLREAYNLYYQWGLTGKSHLLRQEFPEYLSSDSGLLDTVHSKTHDSSSDSSTMHTLDLQTVIRVSRSISEEVSLENLIRKLLRIVMENAGARRSILIMMEEDGGVVAAVGEGESVEMVDSVPVDQYEGVPQTVIHYVKVTGEMVLLNDTAEENGFARDPYFEDRQPKSVLALPIRKQKTTLAILYLENELMVHAFYARRMEILNHLTNQVVISMENASYIERIKKINTDLEKEVEERVKAEQGLRVTLNEKNLLLAEIHHRVKNNLNILSSLIFLQSGMTDNEETIAQLDRIGDRVYSMGLVYAKLIDSSTISRIDMNGYVSELIEHVMDTGNLEQIHLDIHRIHMNIETAIPCGLILNEIISNSLLHAFKNIEKPVIKVRFFREEDNIFRFIVSDNGVGIPESVRSSKKGGLGMRIITLLARQLQGEFDVSTHPDGTGAVYRFSFPEVTKEMERWHKEEF